MKPTTTRTLIAIAIASSVLTSQAVMLVTCYSADGHVGHESVAFSCCEDSAHQSGDAHDAPEGECCDCVDVPVEGVTVGAARTAAPDAAPGMDALADSPYLFQCRYSVFVRRGAQLSWPDPFHDARRTTVLLI